MKRLSILVLWALLGHGWVFAAEAAGKRQQGVSTQVTANRSDQVGHSAQRQGRHARATPRRGQRIFRARLRPGREVIDHSGRPQRGRASYYGREFNGRKMANGRRFNPNSNSAASRSLPLGTVARVKNLRSKQETTVRVEPLGRMLHGLPDVAGTTMLADGRVALMLDVSSLLRSARHSGAAASAFTESSCIA